MSFLVVEGLTVRLRGTPHLLLRDVSLSVAPGRVQGLVGESGAGKSMIGKAILVTLPRAAEIVAGSIRLDGQELVGMRDRDRRRLIGATAALIPQDPLSALNPARRVGGQITDRLVDILGWTRVRADARARELMEEVRIPDGPRVLTAYPHELSGGMRQRILIAAAFAAGPQLIVADEPTTALDVTVQKEILRLIREMQARHGTALLFVTHDLGVVSKICDRLHVLYAGRVVEETDVPTFFRGPAHPYSAALLAAMPRHDDPGAALNPVPADVIAAVAAEVAAEVAGG